MCLARGAGTGTATACGDGDWGTAMGVGDGDRDGASCSTDGVLRFMLLLLLALLCPKVAHLIQVVRDEDYGLRTRCGRAPPTGYVLLFDRRRAEREHHGRPDHSGAGVVMGWGGVASTATVAVLLGGCGGDTVTSSDGAVTADVLPSDASGVDDGWRDYDAWPYWDVRPVDGYAPPIPGENPTTDGKLCVCPNSPGSVCDIGTAWCCNGKFVVYETPVVHSECRCGDGLGCQPPYRCCGSANSLVNRCIVPDLDGSCPP